MKTVRDLGEDSLIQQLCLGLKQRETVMVGPGDDCAVIETTQRGPLSLLKTDAVVEGIHFLPEASAEQVGWKAVARVISDFAAMGGKGRELVVTLAIPPETPTHWLKELYQGMERCATNFHTSIVGGETTSVPAGNAKVISVAGRGEVLRRQLVLRSGGRPGDDLYVTGQLGGSLAGRHLSFTPRAVEADWLTKNFRPSAMMDLSDGLAKDLPRLANASACGFEIEKERIPKHRECSVEQALNDGEDFELLFAISPRSRNRLEQEWPEEFAKLSRIGSLQKSGGELAGGWDHFQ